MGRHVVRSFERMDVRERFRDGMVHGRFKVDADIGICVLVERQRGRRVLDEDVEQADADLSKLRDRVQDVSGNEVEAAPGGRKRDSGLVPHVRSLVGKAHF